MSSLKIIAIVILTISFFTFVAFFGRLPALRHTPIGALHRLIWIHIPKFTLSVDQTLTQGRLSAFIKRQALHLWHDRHPLVLMFFIALLGGSEILFLPNAWHLMSLTHRMIATVLIILPWLSLYAAAASDPGYVTKERLSRQISLYPYDFTNFFPGHTCRTCHVLKPARSKHCSICKHCISKADHHCIFINNCVGYGNQHWFVLLLLSTGNLVLYATHVGLSILSGIIKAEIPSWTARGRGFSWSAYMNVWAWALQGNICIGAVTLLCLLIAPLVYGLLAYHVYLIWAGTTTNESMKWQDWQEDISEGLAFKRSLASDRHKNDNLELSRTTWPAESKQVLQRTSDGLPPRDTAAASLGFGEWVRVWHLKDVENLYDLGFLDNMRDVFLARKDLD